MGGPSYVNAGSAPDKVALTLTCVTVRSRPIYKSNMWAIVILMFPISQYDLPDNGIPDYSRNFSYLLERSKIVAFHSNRRENLGVFSGSASASRCAWISYLECFHVCFSCSASLIKTIIKYCYWQFGWILFYSRNIYIHVNALAEAEPDISGILWLSLSQNMSIFLEWNNIQSDCQ